jgi:6-pyruvoyltetrahydropterin/6-carboxytetrahydropterin synthase
MYEAGLSITFRAWHVMPHIEGPESELHEHDYRMEVVALSRELDAHGMVCDLDVLEAALEQTIEPVRGQQLDEIIPLENADAVTVEVLAHWGHRELARRLSGHGIDSLSVKVWESPDAFGGYSGPLSDSSE